MKKFKRLACILAFILVIFTLTGCLSIEMNVKKNGGLDLVYIIDTSKTEGLISADDIKSTIEETVNAMNSGSDKKVAVLKGVKENKNKKNITATINVKDINEMGDGNFFGTVKEYRKDYGEGLDNLYNKKNEKVEEKKIPNNRQMVSFPMAGTEQYGLVTVTVNVPGPIEYIAPGGEITGKSTATFDGQNLLVVYKKGGGSPLLFLIIVVAVVAFLLLKKKKPTSTPENYVPSAVTEAPVQDTTANIKPQDTVVTTQPEPQASPVVGEASDPEPQASPVVEEASDSEPQASPVVEEASEPEPQVSPVVEEASQPEPQASPVVEEASQPELDPEKTTEE